MRKSRFRQEGNVERAGPRQYLTLLPPYYCLYHTIIHIAYYLTSSVLQMLRCAQVDVLRPLFIIMRRFGNDETYVGS